MGSRQDLANPVTYSEALRVAAHNTTARVDAFYLRQGGHNQATWERMLRRALRWLNRYVTHRRLHRADRLTDGLEEKGQAAARGDIRRLSSTRALSPASERLMITFSARRRTICGMRTRSSTVSS